MSYQASYISRRYSLHGRQAPLLFRPYGLPRGESPVLFQPRRSVPNINLNMLEPAWPPGLPLRHSQQLLSPRSQDTLQASAGPAGAGTGAGQETKDNIETQLENLCLSVTETVLEK